MKKMFVLAVILSCFLLAAASESGAGGPTEVMAWGPRTPAGGAFVDPFFTLKEAEIAKFGEEAIGLTTHQNFITNYQFESGSMNISGQTSVGGPTNFVNTDFTGTGTVGITNNQ